MPPLCTSHFIVHQLRLFPACTMRSWLKTRVNQFLFMCLFWFGLALHLSQPYMDSWSGSPSGVDMQDVQFDDTLFSAKDDYLRNNNADDEDGGGGAGGSSDTGDGVVVVADGGKTQSVSDYGATIDANTEYRKTRIKNFNSWFKGNKTDKLLPNADENGTILDFAIVGFPKCGTTTLEANLGYLAPMPIADVCTPVHQTVWYSYHNWPKTYQKDGEDKLFRGTKCPAFIQGKWLLDYSKYLPRTKLIAGVRHPLLWFQSFWNMQVGNHLTTFAGDDPYKLTEPCPNANGDGCRNGCPSRQLLCMHRGKFHVALASLGKTDLSAEERKTLAANDPDGGTNVRDHKIKNSIFLYEQNMLGEDYMWEELAKYIGAESVPHDKRVNSHGKNRSLEVDFCIDKYDDFRAKMMPIAYEVGTWLQDYFLPLAKNESRTDVVVPRPETFHKFVEAYKVDPCGKLKRLDNGSYVKS